MFFKEKYSEQFAIFIAIFMLSYIIYVVTPWFVKDKVEMSVLLLTAFVNAIVYSGLFTLTLSFFVVVKKLSFKKTLFFAAYGIVIAGLLCYCVLTEHRFHFSVLCLAIYCMCKDVFFLLEEYENNVPSSYSYYDK